MIARSAVIGAKSARAGPELRRYMTLGTASAPGSWATDEQVKPAAGAELVGPAGE
jgi:hypothetical protein